MADDWLAGMAGGGECGGMPAQSWCVAPLGRLAPQAHMPFCSARSSFRAPAPAPSSILGNDHFDATSIDSAPLRSVRLPSSIAVVEAVLRLLPQWQSACVLAAALGTCWVVPVPSIV
jgi:hypothetical protein